MKKLTTKQAREALEGKSNDIDYTVKHHTIYLLSSGELYKIAKPHIDSTIYYSDVCESPFADKDEDGKRKAFMAYNMRNLRPDLCAIEWLEWRDELDRTGGAAATFTLTPMMCESYGGCVRVGCRAHYGEPDRYDIQTRIRDISRDEIEEVAECERDAIAAYEKRLGSYWKRYRKNIWCSGYWADR